MPSYDDRFGFTPWFDPSIAWRAPVFPGAAPSADPWFAQASSNARPLSNWPPAEPAVQSNSPGGILGRYFTSTEPTGAVEANSSGGVLGNLPFVLNGDSTRPSTSGTPPGISLLYPNVSAIGGALGEDAGAVVDKGSAFPTLGTPMPYDSNGQTFGPGLTGRPPTTASTPYSTFPISAPVLGSSPSMPVAAQGGANIQNLGSRLSSGSPADLPNRLTSAPTATPVSYQEGATKPWWGLPLPDPWDYWRQGAIKSLEPFFRRGVGAGARSGDGDDENRCDSRHTDERQRCFDRMADTVSRDYPFGCLDRAKQRWLVCLKNGRPDGPGEVKEWSDDDEETWRNFGR